MFTIRHIFSMFLLGAVILTGCNSLVDEDMSDCGDKLDLGYELQLVTTGKSSPTSPTTWIFRSTTRRATWLVWSTSTW